MSRPPEHSARRSYRFPSELPALVHLPDGPCPCATQDLSRGGVLLVGVFPLPLPTMVDITLKSGHGDAEFRVSARVMRCELETESEQAHLALVFEDLDASQKAALETILARWMEHRAPGALDGIRPGTPPHEIRKVLEAIPLAQRISLAARAGSREREIMAHDPNASVIDALVKNPGITAEEIRALLALPAVSPPVLETIANDVRWGKEIRIRVALAAHPRIPHPRLDRILRDLPEAALQNLLHRPDLTLEIRQKVMKKLKR